MYCYSYVKLISILPPKNILTKKTIQKFSDMVLSGFPMQAFQESISNFMRKGSPHRIKELLLRSSFYG